ncbi:MAG: hypothetical protein K2L22_09300 [Muribaculaceae bacterium]|nr:hypothetical protein [Muribaculaceae bacterium]
MKLMFEQKKPGRTRQSIEPVEIEIEGLPSTVGALIEATVRTCVDAFNHRAHQAPDRDNMDSDSIHSVIGSDRIADLVETGRVSFGIVYNGKTEDPDNAVKNAFQCYEDGIFRIFLNGNLLGELNEEIKVKDGETLTVVRLTMLAGRLW